MLGRLAQLTLCLFDVVGRDRGVHRLLVFNRALLDVADLVDPGEVHVTHASRTQLVSGSFWNGRNSPNRSDAGIFEGAVRPSKKRRRGKKGGKGGVVDSVREREGWGDY